MTDSTTSWAFASIEATLARPGTGWPDAEESDPGPRGQPFSFRPEYLVVTVNDESLEDIAISPTVTVKAAGPRILKDGALSARTNGERTWELYDDHTDNAPGWALAAVRELVSQLRSVPALDAAQWPEATA